MKIRFWKKNDPESDLYDTMNVYDECEGEVFDKIRSFWAGDKYLVKTKEGYVYVVRPSQIVKVIEP